MMDVVMLDILVMYFVYVCLRPLQNTALRLFLSPEEGDDLENKAKQHFHQTGTVSTHWDMLYGLFPSFTCAGFIRQDIAHSSL